ACCAMVAPDVAKWRSCRKCEEEALTTRARAPPLALSCFERTTGTSILEDIMSAQPDFFNPNAAPYPHPDRLQTCRHCAGFFSRRALGPGLQARHEGRLEQEPEREGENNPARGNAPPLRPDAKPHPRPPEPPRPARQSPQPRKPAVVPDAQPQRTAAEKP